MIKGILRLDPELEVHLLAYLELLPIERSAVKDTGERTLPSARGESARVKGAGRTKLG
jgi:hypothetical protein